MKRVITALFFCLLLTGCWDQVELKKLLLSMLSGSITRVTANNSRLVMLFLRFRMLLKEEATRITYMLRQRR